MGKELIIFLFLILIPFVASAPPFQQSSTSVGLILEAPVIETIKLNSEWTFNVHAYNSTNGKKIINDVLSCDIHIYSQGINGKHILEQRMNKSITNSFDMEYNLPENILNISGQYATLLYCNSTNAGGFLEFPFEVTYSGEVIKVGESILYIGFLALLILLFFINFIGMSFLPEKNVRDEEGKIISISYLKYFRNVLWMTGYFFLIMIVYLASNLSFGYLQEEMLGKIFFGIFTIGLAMAPVIVILWVIWIFASIFHDVQFQRMLNRGMFPGGNV